MAIDIQQEIRDTAQRLLESGEVSVVIGYGQGSTPFLATPVFIESPEDVDKLIWGPACANNLAVYLPQEAKEKKVAIVAKGCDARSIVMMVQEKQLDRANVSIIGVPCEGAVEAAAIARIDDVQSIKWDNGKLVVQTSSGTQTLDRDAVVKALCKSCAHPVPVQADTMVGGEEAAARVSLASESRSELPELPEERRKYWAKQFEKCIRCYACRQVCPGCFCKQCFIDRIVPRWAAKRTGASDAWMFHLTRAMHQAGRCVGCGECARVCPVGIPLDELTREVEHHVADLFGYEAGMDPEAEPALGSFKPEDPDPSHG